MTLPSTDPIARPAAARPASYSQARLLVILMVLIIVEINSAFEVGMMYGILATLMKAFGDPVGVGWVVTGFLLVGAASAALASRLGDLYGRRRVVMVMLCFAMLGSLISALSTSLGWLIVGRSVQGVAGALLPLAIGLVREYFPPKRVPVAIGWLAAIASFSASAGIIFGGWLVDHYDWRATFWIGAGHAALSLLCVIFLLPPSRRQAASGALDVWGGVLFAPAIALVLLAVTRLKGPGLTDPVNIGMILLGLGLLALWARREWRHPNPMIDVRLLGQRQIGLTMLIMLLFGLGTSQILLLALLIAQQPVWTGVGLGLTATLASLIKIPAGLSGLVGAPWSGWLAARHGARIAAVIGTLGVSASWLLLMFWHDAIWLLVLLCFMVTLAGSVLYAAVPNLLVEAAPAERTSEVNGMSHVMRTLGTAIGTQVVTLMLVSSTVTDPDQGPGRHPTEAAYQLAFLAVNVCTALSVLVAWLLPRRGADGGAGARLAGAQA